MLFLVPPLERQWTDFSRASPQRWSCSMLSGVSGSRCLATSNNCRQMVHDYTSLVIGMALTKPLIICMGLQTIVIYLHVSSFIVMYRQLSSFIIIYHHLSSLHLLSCRRHVVSWLAPMVLEAIVPARLAILPDSFWSEKHWIFPK